MQYDDVTRNPIWRTDAILKNVLDRCYCAELTKRGEYKVVQNVGK